ncbi:hypothetical protein GPECTOR_2g1097 [Gonium pectorale]|uniref:TLC domain-containing protein n=1 Tax=Gonium pectorale TaxID=33097 RepID=A0A150H102_GONPE|nr:hypothetical protein GPECTOR_2g1097 [Gonium pectorale]|eukprot:KXZ55548.1 hypothetical protein GPECTOR_2g1097 [Gonium pectorale]
MRGFSFIAGGGWGGRPDFHRLRRDRQSARSSASGAGPSGRASYFEKVATLISQQAVREGKEAPPYDPLRTLRMGGYGFLWYGPCQYYWYNLLDWLMPIKTTTNFLSKVAANQLILAPITLSSVFGYNLALTGRADAIPNKLRDDLWPTMQNGWKFWIPAASLNFYCVPLKYQDVFNLVCIAWLNATNLYYLITGRQFQVFYISCLLYFIADLVYVGVVPRCVKSPLVILAHHVITALYMLIPYHYPQYEWCMSYCMLVEVNTWLLIAKRTVRLPFLEALFYVTWVLLRNIYYPYLIWVFYREWKLQTQVSGSPWNPILITPVFQTALTGLNFYWTLQLFTKPKKYKQL